MVISERIWVKSLVLLGLASVLWASDVEQARKLYNLTDFTQSLKILEAIPHKDAEAYELIGRNLYMEGDFKKAGEAFEKAVAAEPGRSDGFLWLARAYGRRAEGSNPFTAPGYASKARQNFEKAVQLDPRNLDALNDLFDYYMEAPGILGGGVEKAQALVPRIAQVSEGDSQSALSKLAEKRKQYAAAEDHLRRAIQAAPQHVGRYIDLAQFLTKQGRHQEADESFARADKVAPNSPELMFAKAELYIKSGRHLQVARDLLKRYLTSAITPDDPPRKEALKLLKQVQGG